MPLHSPINMKEAALIQKYTMYFALSRSRCHRQGQLLWVCQLPVLSSHYNRGEKELLLPGRACVHVHLYFQRRCVCALEDVGRCSSVHEGRHQKWPLSLLLLHGGGWDA